VEIILKNISIGADNEKDMTFLNEKSGQTRVETEIIMEPEHITIEMVAYGRSFKVYKPVKRLWERIEGYLRVFLYDNGLRLIRIKRKDNGANYTKPGEYEITSLGTYGNEISQDIILS